MKNYYRVFLYPEYSTPAIKEVAITLCEYNTAKVPPPIDMVFKMVSRLVKENLSDVECQMINDHTFAIDVKTSSGNWHTALYTQSVVLADLINQETEY